MNESRRGKKYPRWTVEDEKILLATILKLAKRLNRSPIACVHHCEWLVRNADRLKLRFGGES